MGSQSLKNIQKKFKLRGLTLTVSALKVVTEFINDFTEAEDEALELVLDEIERASLKTTVLDKEAVEQILSPLTGTAGDSSVDAVTNACNQSGLRIIDVFLVSKFSYDSIRKMFYE